MSLRSGSKCLFHFVDTLVSKGFTGVFRTALHLENNINRQIKLTVSVLYGSQVNQINDLSEEARTKLERLMFCF